MQLPQQQERPGLRPLEHQETKEMLDSVVTLTKNATKPQGNQFQDVEAFLAEMFDLAKFARTKVSGEHSALDLRWFPDPAFILTLQKDIDLCRRKGSTVPYVSQARVEHWQPQWLGEGKLEGERDRIVKERKKESAASSTSVCTSSIGFWLAHLATGQIETMHVLAHALFMIKPCDERGHSFAAKYQSRLRICLQVRIQAGEQFDLGESISKINYDFIREVQVEQAFFEEGRARRRRKEEDPPPSGGGGRGGGGRGGGKGGDKGDRAAAARAAKSGAADSSRHIEKRNICFFHHPAKNLTCSRGDDCRNEHLDTSVPEKLERFNNAKKRFDEVKLTSKKLATREWGHDSSVPNLSTGAEETRDLEASSGHRARDVPAEESPSQAPSVSPADFAIAEDGARGPSSDVRNHPGEPQGPRVRPIHKDGGVLARPQLPQDPPRGVFPHQDDHARDRQDSPGFPRFEGEGPPGLDAALGGARLYGSERIRPRPDREQLRVFQVYP